MRKSNAARRQTRNVPSGEISSLSWRYLVVVVICGCVLAAGFFFAARLHFTSMDFGIKNSELRKQLEDLEAENRRLLLAREVSLAPSEIKRVAKNLGFREMAVYRVPVSIVSDASKVKAETAKSTTDKLPISQEKLPNVKLTAYQRPAKSPLNEPSLSGEPADKPAKRTGVVSKDKKDRTEITTIAKLK